MITVLVVDDDPLVRTGLRMILGLDVDLALAGEAADGEEALARIGELRPDVVLLDVRMPELDGLGVLQRLQGRADAPAVVVLTTFDTDDYVLRALAAGARGFLLKDADPTEMIAAVKAAHRGEPVLSPSVTATVIRAATAAPTTDPTAVAMVADLTDREREVARLLLAGRTNAEIGGRLAMSLATVKAHVTRIFTKVGVDNRVSAAMVLRDAGL
ncbi:response regulator transcription factor [Raineyella sp. LH-20]|uniref:response regulator transcription factor n=1 Tax=Raineyella sp. LH-20 TaxID=3081204 RepID=UPI002952E555|nr:response regulator transcription factor [Raineyella sp. LH-20]WOP19815.1 response regulator transcription factor [Raineyella sp. LH-20]